MPAQLPQCPSCNAPLTEGVFNLPEPNPCPACGTPIQIHLFPAWFRPPAVGNQGERILLEGEAGCFYHPEKKAVQPCAACGRFLCALCDCELQGQHFCPGCLDAGRQKGKIKNLENQRMLYDSIALSLAILPIITVYFTIITAPMALYMVIRHWNSPSSVVHHTRWRFVVAAILAILQIVGWCVAAYFIVKNFRSHG